jgi:hypothetical protein
VRVEHDERLLAELADLRERAMEVRARFEVHADQIGAGLRVGGDPRFGVLDHQVDVEREAGGFLHGLDHERTDRQVRDEVSVHDIDVHVVGGRDGLDLFGEPTEIGRQDGGRNADRRARHRAQPITSER